jgi:hypothetical protein
MKVNSQPIHQEGETSDQLKHLVKKRPLLGETEVSAWAQLWVQLGQVLGVSDVCVGELMVSGISCCQQPKSR